MNLSTRWKGALGGLSAGLIARSLWRARNRMSLDGAVALVTGGSRGLGLLIARTLADEGCRLVICARDSDELEIAARELSAVTEVLAVRCDVADREAVERMVAEAIDHFGGLDIVVNNASIIQVGPVETQTLEDFRQAMEVNFWGTVHTTLAGLPHLRRSGRARICNITSIGGKVAVPHLLPYDCAKFAAVGFSEGLRAELAKDGVLVTTVVPGLMRTGSPENALFKGAHAAEYAWFAAGDATPLTAMSAERAARRIVRALALGEAEVTLSWQARVLRYAHALFPSTTVWLLGIANRLLPAAAGPTPLERGRDIDQRPMSVRNLVEPLADDTNQFVGP